ncbi:MAG: SPFH domain-containing protein [Clostridia bacterium]|nr:SPFH domain-containing protein [Clostridia bacterium]
MSQIAELIKYEGDNSTFIWKHPSEDFNSLTQLIVHESQEAIFMMNGQALDLFGPGRYTLETQNIPKIGGILKNLVVGKDSPFHCEVYFINKTVQMAIKWGTDSKVRFIEPTMGIPLEIGACGELNLQVSDSRKLLVKLVGTMNGIAWGDSGAGFTKSIQNCFKPLISTAVKSHLASSIKSENIDLLEIDEHLEKLSQKLHSAINPGFEEYGLTIPQFYLTTVLLPENDPNFRRLRDLHTVSLQTRMIQADALVRSAQADADAAVTAAQRQVVVEQQTTETAVARAEAERQVIAAQAAAQATRMQGIAEADVMAAMGYTQRDVLAADVQKAYAEGIGNMTINGGGGVAGDVIGLGVGIAAAGAVAPQLGQMFQGVNPTGTPAQAPTAKCAKCGAPLPENAKFCLECGEKVAPASADTVVCPQCGNTVAKGKFCPECGHKFVTECPKCGAAVSGGKFCPECGEKL